MRLGQGRRSLLDESVLSAGSFDITENPEAEEPGTAKEMVLAIKIILGYWNEDDGY